MGVGTVLGGADRPLVGRSDGKDSFVCGFPDRCRRRMAVDIDHFALSAVGGGNLLVMLTGTSLTTLSDALAADERSRDPQRFPVALSRLGPGPGAAAGPVLTYLLLESGADLWGYAVAAVGFAGITGFWHRVDPATVQGGGGSDAASVCAAVPVEKDVLQRKERRP